MTLVDTMVAEESAAEELLKKLWGGESRAVTVEKVLELEAAGKAAVAKLGFAPGEVGVVVNGRVRSHDHSAWVHGLIRTNRRSSAPFRKRSLLRISIRLPRMRRISALYPFKKRLGLSSHHRLLKRIRKFSANIAFRLLN